MDSMKEALSRHLAKAKEHLEHAHAAVAGDPGVGTDVGDATPDDMDPAKSDSDRAPQLDAKKAPDMDPNHKPEDGDMARSGGAVNSSEHEKIMHALMSGAPPKGKAPMTLNERAGDKAKEKYASMQKHKKV